MKLKEMQSMLSKAIEQYGDVEFMLAIKGGDEESAGSLYYPSNCDFFPPESDARLTLEFEVDI